MVFWDSGYKVMKYFSCYFIPIICSRKGLQAGLPSAWLSPSSAMRLLHVQNVVFFLNNLFLEGNLCCSYSVSQSRPKKASVLHVLNVVLQQHTWFQWMDRHQLVIKAFISLLMIHWCSFLYQCWHHTACNHRAKCLDFCCWLNSVYGASCLKTHIYSKKAPE